MVSINIQDPVEIGNMIYDVETFLIITYFFLYYKVVTTLSQGYHNAFLQPCKN